MQQKVIERIESHKIEKYGRITLICGLGALLIGILRIFFTSNINLTGLGFWADLTIVAGLPIYFGFKTQKQIKKRSGQFVEWTNESLIFKAKNEIQSHEISLSEIISIIIQLDEIRIETISKKEFLINISDFDNYNDRMKIKSDFEKMKTTLANPS